MLDSVTEWEEIQLLSDLSGTELSPHNQSIKLLI